MAILGELFPDALMVLYATPGVDLAKAFFNANKKRTAPGKEEFELVFLQNHGLVVSAETAEKVIDKMEEVVSIIERLAHIHGYHEAKIPA